MKVIFLIFFLFAASSLIAQQDTRTHSNIIVPVPVEGLGGNNRFVLSTLVKKPFTPTSRFSLLSVTNAASSYKNDLQDFDFINVTQVSYNLYKGFGVTAGISLNNVSGFSPTAGIQYVYTRRTILLVIAPDISLTNSHNVEGVFVSEYRPELKRNISLYTHLQAFYNYEMKDKSHQRSYINTRLGLSFGLFTFGAGANFDWYGPLKIYKGNYGPFLRYSFL
ncbi:MAG: hypothetical protein ACJ748_04275 [Flavisolibacter sp.]